MFYFLFKGLQLQEVGDFEARNCQPAMNPPPRTQNLTKPLNCQLLVGVVIRGFLSTEKSSTIFLLIILSVHQNQVQQFFEVSKFELLLCCSQF